VQVADWLDTCRELVGWEDEHLVERCGPESLSEHATMLDRLEGIGQWLAAAVVAPAPHATAVAQRILKRNSPLIYARSFSRRAASLLIARSCGSRHQPMAPPVFSLDRGVSLRSQPCGKVAVSGETPSAQ